MRVGLFWPAPSLTPSVSAMKALESCFKSRGYDVTAGDWASQDVSEFDFVVVCGWKKRWLNTLPGYAWPRNGVIEAAEKLGTPILVVERGAFQALNRNKLSSVSWNGLNGASTYLKRGADPDPRRWHENFEHRLTVRPWRDIPIERKVLLLGQVPRDAAVDDCPNYQAFLDSFWNEVPEFHFRPHPKAQNLTARGCRTVAGPVSLSDVVGQYSRTISWSSTAGVESVLAGVPHEAYGVSSWVKSVCCEVTRRRWLHGVVWSQWSDHELASGEAMSHLMDVYEDLHA